MSPPLPALPPYAEWLGVTAERGEDGAPAFAMPFTVPLVGRPGFVHGGALAGLLEIAAIGSLTDRLQEEPAAVRLKPVTVALDFIRGGRERTTYAAARITRLGARVANVEAHAWQESPDKAIAAARVTLMLYRD